jgi:hypothetical protein
MHAAVIAHDAAAVPALSRAVGGLMGQLHGAGVPGMIGARAGSLALDTRRGGGWMVDRTKLRRPIRLPSGCRPLNAQFGFGSLFFGFPQRPLLLCRLSSPRHYLPQGEVDPLSAV